MAEAIAFQILATTGITATQTAIAVATTVASVGLSVATSAIISALTPLPPSPKQSILVNARDPAAPQEFIYGETRKGGITTYYESTRKGSVLYQIIAVAAHEVESIDTIYVNDKAVTLSPDGYDNGSRSGAGWVTDDEWTDDDTEHEIRIFYHTGDQTSITDTFANSSTETLDSVFFDTGSSDEDSKNFGGTGQPTKASFVGNGIAYIFVRYAFNSSVFSKGLPLITCKLKGKKVYDPRSETTVYSNNAALCIRDYITSAYGLGDSEVDDTVFTVAANVCDEDVTLDAGGTEDRYTLNGVIRADQSYGDVLQQMITSCSGTLFWGGGKWKLTVGEYNAPTKVLTLDDLRSNISVQTRTNLRDQFNSVQGVFTDATNRYLVADYPPITSATFLAQDDGIEQALDLDLPFTTSSPMAQRLAKMTLFRGREQQVLSADFGLNAFDVEVGEVIALTFDRYGWDEKEFEVIGWDFNSSSEGGDLRVSLTLRETSSAAFSWAAEETEIISNDSDLFVPLGRVQNLQAAQGGIVSSDGTYINTIQVTWNSLAGAGGYDIQWRKSEFDFDSNGGVVEEADAVTTREQFIYKAYVEILYRQPDQDGFDFYNTGGGSSLTEEQLRVQLAGSSERVTNRFTSLGLGSGTLEHEIVPVLDNTLYDIRVRGTSSSNSNGPWVAVTFSSTQDTTAPNAPTTLTAVGYFQSAVLQWADASPANDLAQYNIYRSSSNSFGSSELVGSATGKSYNDGGLADNTTYYYWVTAQDYSGNESSESNSASATTNFISAAEMVADIRDEIGAARIDVVSSLPSGTGYSAGDFVYLTSNKKLYQFNGTAWVLAVTAVEAVDISGKLQTAQIAVGAITEGLIAANAVTATKIEDGSISTPKIVTGAITAGTIATGAITAVKIATNAVTADKIIADAITANKIATNAVTTDALAANSVTANQLTTNSVTTGKIAAGAVSADKIAVTSLAAIEANLGEVTAGSINTLSGGVGLQVNVSGKPRAVYSYQNSTSIYGLFAQNIALGGGTMEIRSNGGFTSTFLNSNISSGAFGPFVAVNAQNTGTGGGHGQAGVSLAGGGYAFRSIDGGFYDVGGDGYNPFTGRHDGMISKSQVYDLGDIVVDSDVIVRGLSDSFTELQPSISANDPSVVGVVAKVYSEWYVPASFVDSVATRLAQDGHTPTPNNPMAPMVTTHEVSDYEDDYDLVNINAVGEGAVNVCGEGGNISKGDLIVTSSTPGKGMKQSDDIVRSYTVAKAREDITFADPTEVKMVACIYLCG